MSVFTQIKLGIICCFLLSPLVYGNDNLTVNYLENVIKKGQSEAYTYQLSENAYEHMPESEALTEYGTFDYIIVGAGSAGAVIATRLSERKDLKILLIEAGGYATPHSDIPGEMIFMQGSRLNWNYKSVPQMTSCQGMINKQCAIPRGKSVGGSSTINALMYVRGNKHDFDLWAKAGNPGWSYKEVLPYFKKSENSQIKGDCGYHGEGGLLNVEYATPPSPQFQAFVDANVELGRKVVDYNGEQQLGVAQTQFNNVNGKRGSTGEAFLKSALKRDNFKILTDCFASKILIDVDKKKAYGVQFSHKKQLFAARASREVILSAGSIGSPQLLMLSGIGPEAHLKEHNIKVIQNLAVGQNLQDHATYWGLYFTSNYSEPMKSLTEHVRDYLNKNGLLTFAGNSQGVAFLQTKLMKVRGVPDVEIIMIPSIAINDYIKKAFRYTDETYEAIWGKLKPENAFSFYPILLHPRSNGTVRLRSNNPYDYPLIDPKFLSDSEGIDIEKMYQALQMVMEIVNTTAFQKYSARLVDAGLPACAEYEYLSKEYWYCHIRHLTTHIYHPVGTCKMGPKVSRGAVVDHRLRVYGIKNLRVADASIIPDSTSGHVNAVAIMIGEKIADMIKEEIEPIC